MHLNALVANAMIILLIFVKILVMRSIEFSVFCLTANLSAISVAMAPDFHATKETRSDL